MGIRGSIRFRVKDLFKLLYCCKSIQKPQLRWQPAPFVGNLVQRARRGVGFPDSRVEGLGFRVLDLG